jgi:hypothetical protein
VDTHLLPIQSFYIPTQLADRAVQGTASRRRSDPHRTSLQRVPARIPRSVWTWKSFSYETQLPSPFSDPASRLHSGLLRSAGLPQGQLIRKSCVFGANFPLNFTVLQAASTCTDNDGRIRVPVRLGAAATPMRTDDRLQWHTLLHSPTCAHHPIPSTPPYSLYTLPSPHVHFPCHIFHIHLLFVVVIVKINDACNCWFELSIGSHCLGITSSSSKVQV